MAATPTGALSCVLVGPEMTALGVVLPGAYHDRIRDDVGGEDRLIGPPVDTQGLAQPRGQRRRGHAVAGELGGRIHRHRSVCPVRAGVGHRQVPGGVKHEALRGDHPGVGPSEARERRGIAGRRR